MKFDHRFVLREASPSMRCYSADGVTMRLDFLEGMLRVALLREQVPLVPTWSRSGDRGGRGHTPIHPLRRSVHG